MRLKLHGVVFNPSPFIKAIESSIDEMNKLNRLVQRRIGEAEDNTKTAETLFKGKLVECQSSFEVDTDELTLTMD